MRSETLPPPQYSMAIHRASLPRQLPCRAAPFITGLGIPEARTSPLAALQGGMRCTLWQSRRPLPCPAAPPAGQHQHLWNTCRQQATTIQRASCRRQLPHRPIVQPVVLLGNQPAATRKCWRQLPRQGMSGLMTGQCAIAEQVCASSPTCGSQLTMVQPKQAVTLLNTSAIGQRAGGCG